MFKKFVGLVITAIIFSLCVFVPQANASSSAIDDRYNSDAELRDVLGSSMSPEYAVAGGKMRIYQRGTLYYHPATGVHEAHGVIRTRFQQLGGLQVLGFPLSDQIDIFDPVYGNTIAKVSHFQNVVLMTNPNEINAYRMRTEIFEKWGQYMGDFGAPTTDEYDVAGGRGVAFGDQGRIFWTSSTGARALLLQNWGYGIGDTYQKLSGPYGFLGFPKSDLMLLGEYDPIAGRWEGSGYEFQHGVIIDKGFFFDDEVPGFEIHGAILNRWSGEGGLATLGYPTSNELSAPGGRISHFDNGDVFWNATTHQTTVTWF